MVDRIIEMEEGRRAVGIKNVTINEWYFPGHFPGEPIMPGVLIVEAMAQVGAAVLLSMKENQGKNALFAGIDEFRFRRPVVPGDTLRMEVTLGKRVGRIGKGKAIASVDGQVVAEGIFTFVLAKAVELTS